MPDSIITDSLAEAEAIIAKIDSLLGLPDKENNTLTYAIPREHETRKGQYMIPIKSIASRKVRGGRPAIQELLDVLSTADKRTIKSREVLKAEGAFPTLDERRRRR